MEEANLLLTEKQFFEYLGDSKLKTFSSFADIKILLQESKWKPFNRILLYNCRAFDWHFDGRNQTVSYAECQVWRFRQVSIKNSFWNFGTMRTLMQEKPPTVFQSTDLSKLRTSRLGSSCNNSNLMFPRNLSLNVEKNQIHISFWNFQTINFVLPETNSTTFQRKGLPKGENFRLRPWWKRSSL